MILRYYTRLSRNKKFALKKTSSSIRINHKSYSWLHSIGLPTQLLITYIVACFVIIFEILQPYQVLRAKRALSPTKRNINTLFSASMCVNELIDLKINTRCRARYTLNCVVVMNIILVVYGSG